MMAGVRDRQAEELEVAGLWRRAAHRWLMVLDNFPSDDEQRFIHNRIRKCLNQARSGGPRAKDTVRRVAFRYGYIVHYQ